MSVQAPMRLYSFEHSPNPLKVRLALAELGLDYEIEEIRLFRGEHRSPSFTEVNPHQKVPVLELDGHNLRESNAILTYLGDVHGELWPSEPMARARALQWLFFESVHLAPPCGSVWWADTVGPAIGREGSHEAILADAVEELESSLSLLEAHLKDRDHILGDTFSLVDCSIGVDMAMLKGTRIDSSERWPRAHAYRLRIMARESWTQARGNSIHTFG